MKRLKHIVQSPNGLRNERGRRDYEREEQAYEREGMVYERKEQAYELSQYKIYLY